MKQSNLIGIIFKLLNCLLFSMLSLVTIYCVQRLPVIQVLFSRSCIGIILCLIYLVIIKQPIVFPKKDFWLYVARAVISLIAMQLWIIAIQSLGINEATALSYTGPFWVFLAARYIIGEAFSWSSLIAIIVNMLGVLLILQPGLENITWQGVGASLGSILLWVIYEIICKKQTTTEHYMLQSFYVLIIGAIIIFPFVWLQWQPTNSEDWVALSLLAALGLTNITVIFIAYLFAPMMVISPFSYARLVFTALLTAWAHNVIPHINVFIGSMIILIVNFYFAYINKKAA
jgi:drug/metabolite transporter (DMT)-like permease